MIRTSFNGGWRVRPKVSPFAELAGASVPFRSVVVPHDTMIEQDRVAPAPGEGATAGAAGAYLPGGVFEYQDVPDPDRPQLAPGPAVRPRDRRLHPHRRRRGRRRDGTPHPCAHRPVFVEVSGAGVLLGFGSADPSTGERFDATTRRTYDGRVLAVLRSPAPARSTAGSMGTRARAINVRVTSRSPEPRKDLVQRSAPFLPDGSGVQQVFIYQTAPSFLFFLMTYVTGLTTSRSKYRCVAVTRDAIYVLESSRLSGGAKPQRLLGRLPRATRLGPVSGRWGQVKILGERAWVHKRFHDQLAAADHEAGFTP